MSVYDAMRGAVIDLPVGTILPGWVTKAAVINAIDRLQAEDETTTAYACQCDVCPCREPALREGRDGPAICERCQEAHP